MEIQFEESASKGSFYHEEQGIRLAEMTFSKAGENLLIIDHTEVSDKLKGKGAGKQLVTAAVDYARSKQIKILPLCPFAKSLFEKTPAFNDVLN
jgi:predicted GNAT family acetyltransferase